MTSFVGTEGPDSFGGSDGDDVAMGLGGPDTLSGQDGEDRLHGGDGADVLRGGQFDNAGDELDGGDGDDSLWAEDGDEVHGGAGQDHVDLRFDIHQSIVVDLRALDVGEAAVFSDGTILSGVESGYISLAGGANRLILSDYGAFTVSGGYGDDTILGGAADDHIEDDAGSDRLKGGGGADTIQAGANNDLLAGNAGDDTLRGGAGDTFKGGAGEDGFYVMVDRSPGIGPRIHADMREVSNGLTFIGAGIYMSQVETGTFYLALKDDVVIGDRSPLRVFGNSGDDALTGGSGDDVLSGGFDDDILSGGRGADTLISGEGHDVLRGGEGDDTYQFFQTMDPAQAQTARLSGLQAGDTIDLSGMRWTFDPVRFVDQFTGAGGEAIVSYASGADRTTIAVDRDGDLSADLEITIAGDQRQFDNFIL